MHAEQQRYWIALLNLQRTWTRDEQATLFIPPRHRDFESKPHWSQPKAEAYLLNNLELIRSSWRLLEDGGRLDWDSLNNGLETFRLKLHPWREVGEIRAASQARADMGGRLESLQAFAPTGDLNPGTLYVRATVVRSLYYFAHYIDSRLADPAYPAVTPGRLCVREAAGGSGDLELVVQGEQAAGD